MCMLWVFLVVPFFLNVGLFFSIQKDPSYESGCFRLALFLLAEGLILWIVFCREVSAFGGCWYVVGVFSAIVMSVVGFQLKWVSDGKTPRIDLSSWTITFETIIPNQELYLQGSQTSRSGARPADATTRSGFSILDGKCFDLVIEQEKQIVWRFVRKCFQGLEGQPHPSRLCEAKSHFLDSVSEAVAFECGPGSEPLSCSASATWCQYSHGGWHTSTGCWMSQVRIPWKLLVPMRTQGSRVTALCCA